MERRTKIAHSKLGTMPLYTDTQLRNRNRIIQSQKLLFNFLDNESINNLVDLFTMRDTNSKSEIVKLIEEEQNVRGIFTHDISVESKIYTNKNKTDSTLHLQIKKDGADFLHLSIHLCVQALNPKNSGIFHIVKNIYNIRSPLITKKELKKITHIPILIQQPPDKPNSLVFNIVDGYDTPSKVQTAILYDSLVKKEMDVILTVLNRLFDEDDEYYIGNKNKLVPIHKNTNVVLKNMNKYTQYVERKNKGALTLPSLNTENHSYNNYSIRNRNSTRKQPKKKLSVRTTTRKRDKRRV